MKGLGTLSPIVMGMRTTWFKGQYGESENFSKSKPRPKKKFARAGHI